MAWSEKLASGRHRGRYRDRQGNIRSLPHTYSQPSEAERAAAVKEDEVRRRPAARKRAARMACGEWLDEWTELRRQGSAKIRRVEPGTLGRDLSRIKRHIRPYWEDVPLDEIDREAVEEWQDELRQTPLAGQAAVAEAERKTLAPRTVIKIVTVFAAAMRDAVKIGKIDVSPCALLELDQPEADDEYFLTPEEFDRLIENADELTRFVSDVAVGTGLRWGELAGLHRARVVTKHLRVLVQEVYDKEAGEIKPYPKGRSRRGVPITAELAAKIDAWMKAHPATPCRTRHRDDKPCRGSLLVPSGAGTVLAYNNFRRRHWDYAAEAAGLVGVSPHDLRHTYASWLIQSGRVTLDELGVLLGHKDRRTTQRYAHFGEDHWGEVRDVFAPAPAAPTTPDEAALREAIARLAAEQPEAWGSVAEALTAAEGEKAAPHLLHKEDHEEGGKIIHMDRWRRSTGS